MMDAVEVFESPAAKGFFMPAEWTAHERCWMAWPRRVEAYCGYIQEARAAYAAVAHAIVEFEPVTMIAHPEDESPARKMLSGDITVLPELIDDAWMRDSGPTFLLNAKNKLAGVDWQFNAWGEKFSPWDKDAALAQKILAALSCRRFAAPFILEGGSIHVDDVGNLLTTEQCLLNANRNPHLSRHEIEKLLSDYLGATNIVWLAGDLNDKDTDGHVDNIACFAGDNRVLLVVDELNPMRAENHKLLKAAKNAKGEAFEIIALPSPVVMEEGEDLLASYVNFYFANGGIVMPSFGVAEDDVAYGIMRDIFFDRKIKQVPAIDIIRGGGGIHCITQQQPKV